MKPIAKGVLLVAFSAFLFVLCIWDSEAHIPHAVCKVKSENDTTLRGVYNGKNIYIQNPLAYPGNQTTKWCIQEYPTINGNSTTRIFTSSSLEIDLSVYGLKIGDSVTIEIPHGDCEIKILNPEVLKSGYGQGK